jgi:hypothetical protein
VPTRKSPEDTENSAPDPRIEEDAATETPTGEPPVPEEKEPTNIVRYTGLVSERRISREEWEQAGVLDQDGVAWTKDANSVPIDQFSEEALQVLANTGEFEVIRDVRD